MDNISFDTKRIAEGYAKRPWLHKQVMERLVADVGIAEGFQNGLDVGCGAGLSSKALKLVCDKVTGTDISEAMTEVCRKLYPEANYRFYTAAAEDTRVPAEKYDIVTAAGVINWVNKEKFLRNMHEVMRPGGLLVIYDFWITDQMAEGDAYTDWYRDCYLQEFPKPPRKETIWTRQDMGGHFVIKKQVTYELEYEFNLHSFIEFMMIQSNVNAQIESGQKTEAEVKSRMEQTLSSIFGSNTRTLIFQGYSWYIKHN